MITVAILINGQPLLARAATNQGRTNSVGETLYRTDAGVHVWHRRDEGAIALAKKLLDTIDDEGTRRKAGGK